MPTNTAIRSGSPSSSRDSNQQNVTPTIARSTLRSSCDYCQNAKMKCSQDKPSCKRCLRQSVPCVYSPLKRIGRPRKQATAAGTPQPPPVSCKATFETIYHDTEHTALEKSQQSFVPNTTGPEMTTVLHLDSNTHLEFGDREGDDGNGDCDFGMMRHSSEQEMGDFETYLNSQNIDDMLLADLGIPFERDVPDFPIQELNNEPVVNGNHLRVSGNMFNVGENHPLLDTTTSLAESTTEMNIFFGQLSGSPNLSRPPSQTLLTPSTLTSPGSKDTCKQRCYACLTQQLMYLNERVPDTYDPSIDLILAFEKETRSIKDKVFACSACLSNRSTLLILSVIMERVLEMIEKMTRNIHTPGKGRRGRGNSINDGSWKRFQFNASVTCPALRTDCVLLIGNFEVEEECKTPFIKLLLQRRLGRFGSMLTDLERAMEARLKDCNYRAADGIVNDAYRRLESLRGMIELWE